MKTINKQNIWILLSALSIMCISCDAFYKAFPPSDKYYVKRDAPIETEIIRETIYVNNVDGNLKAVPAGSHNKILTFSQIGQEYWIKKGENIAIETDNIDFSIASFEFETSEKNQDILMKLVDKDSYRVLLSRKCQTIVRMGTNFIPKIEVQEGLDPEQVVVTPLFDDDCNKVGHEIRYGSTERGCSNVAFSNLKRFRECTGKTIRSSDPCRDASLCRKLGLNPCCTK